MAFDSYSGLQEAIARWLRRRDMTAAIPDFIALAEVRMNRELRLAAMNDYADKKIPGLSDSNTTNYILANAPDVYLYASLIEASPYVKDDARIGLWKAAYDTAISNFQTKEDILRYPNGLTIAGDVVNE